jgi:membrane-associated protein
MIEFLSNLCDPVWIMQNGGLYIIVAIVFAETGLFAGFFLPGDTLLFIAGVILAHHNYPFNHEVLSLCYWLALIMLAGIIGNFTGYWIGKKSGTLLFERKDTWLFKKKHLIHARQFYETRGGGAIVAARFLPLVRTFAPVVAGMVEMDFRKFALYNVVSSVAWVASIVLAGYFLGNISFVKEHLEFIMIGIVLCTTLPVVINLLKTRKTKK